ncbi:hypothetical protein ISCGN_030030 [Ixodes scapularis]
MLLRNTRRVFMQRECNEGENDRSCTSSSGLRSVCIFWFLLKRASGLVFVLRKTTDLTRCAMVQELVNKELTSKQRKLRDISEVTTMRRSIPVPLSPLRCPRVQ